MSVANVSPLAGVLTIFLVAVTPAWAADNLSIERLATCQELLARSGKRVIPFN